MKMRDENNPQIRTDYQDAQSKKIKRIISIIYIGIMIFIVGGSYLHQQKNDRQAQLQEQRALSGISNP